MMNETQVSLRVDVISNICCKGQLSQEVVMKWTFYLSYFIQKII